MMETHQKESMKRIRRHSQSVLQDLHLKVFKDEVKDTRSRGRRGERPLTPTWRNSLDSVFTRKGSLILLDGNNAVEIYKTNKSSQPGIRGRLSDLYLPAITGTMSNLQAARAKLSHSCPYLSTSRRRGSTSSINSQRAPDFKQSYLKAQKESKKSNVIVTMTYLGQGLPGNTQDEMKVLQQICGGENICVFKGFVQPGEQIQFTSQRHLGFPFSATIFVNGIMAARISSCCEYRYAPGFQQGRRSCFRLTRLNGGKPCYKCVNSRHGIGTPAVDSPAPTLTRAINSNDGVMDLPPSSPLFIPLGMERSVHKARKYSKEGGALSTDSEDMNGSVKERRHHKRPKKPRSQWGEGQGLEESQPHKDGNELEDKPLSNTKEQLQTSAKENVKVTENKIKVPDSLQEGKTLTKRDGEKTMDPSKLNGKSRNRGRLRDFYEECVEMSTGLESGLDQQRWFKVNKFERNKIKDQLTSGLPANGSASEVELSEESDSSVTEAREPKINSKQGPEDEKQQDLQKQMDAMTEVLNNSDEVEQLILRNTGLTDELLKSLATALKRSPSEVTVINLNLNQIGPPGITVLLDLLQAKPQIKELLLFGNQLGDLGVQTLLSGLAELQNKTAALHGNSDQIYFSTVSIVIKELDIGGNGFGSDGLRVLATFMRYHSHLQYLGLAQTSCSDMEAWTVLFESLKVNTSLTHIILDESSLGENGIKLFSEALRSNETLRKVDLDNNGFGEVGGHYLLEALRFGGKCSLEHLSLEGNYISTALLANIQQELKSNRPAAL
ncbi:uncharacterized protein LOC130072093 isoform X2 [Rhinichthys klamathensis goyatoka]|uniref:uncharacterized protein LOC130072093 isoform X2 n=1 Tax=Rhinichthys klamathensis goyatoka TaxID=3034132 RepID=UPI0024B5C144|nr:uncharacterized protein LOC130072093 isoform X2 [Rhinichthys klamathensis goyatoka]